MNSYAGAVRDQLDRLFHRGTAAGLGEGALLERYVSDRDEAAFAALVARHGPMVLGVCRRVLRDDRDVEDAFQATFLVLVRRAGSIRDGDLLGRWLHGVAHRVAVRARAQAARRFAREKSASLGMEFGGGAPAGDEAGRRELASIVDEEVGCLPSALRAAVVLCYLEGMTHDEAARRLGWPVGTVRSRMARARDVLRRRLKRRGVAADGAAVVAVLARPVVPPEWLDATVRNSLNFANHTAAAAAALGTSRSAALARRVLQTMVITKLTGLGAAGLGIVLALGGVQTLAFQDKRDTGPDVPAPGVPAPGAIPAPGGQDAPSQKAPVDEAGHQAERIERELSTMQKEFDKLTTELAALKAQIEERDIELAALKARIQERKAQLPTPRNERLTQAGPAAASPPTPRKRAENTADSDHPYYFTLGQQVVVISPDGSKAAVYDPQSDKTRTLKLPEMVGVRREFLPGTSFGMGGRLAVNTAASHWLPALEVDGDRKVVRILALNVRDGKVIEIKPSKPFIDRASLIVPQSGTICLGNNVYALSLTAGRWCPLLGVEGSPRFEQGAIWAQKDGRLFRFNYTTGEWDDIYARALEGPPT